VLGVARVDVEPADDQRAKTALIAASSIEPRGCWTSSASRAARAEQQVGERSPRGVAEDARDDPRSRGPRAGAEARRPSGSSSRRPIIMEQPRSQPDCPARTRRSTRRCRSPRAAATDGSSADAADAARRSPSMFAPASLSAKAGAAGVTDGRRTDEPALSRDAPIQAGRAQGRCAVRAAADRCASGTTNGPAGTRYTMLRRSGYAGSGRDAALWKNTLAA